MQEKADDEPVPTTLGNKRVNDKGWLKKFLAIRPSLLRLVGRIVRPDEIEDIVQETFILSYMASRKRKIDNPHAYMMKTAKNIAFNIIKRADKKLHFSFEEMLDDDFDMHMEDVEQRYQAEEMFIHFCRAVAELPLECRRVFILKKIYGFSQDEITGRLGISSSMVEKHVAKGMALTGKYMVTQGYWDESEILSLANGKKDREAK